MTTPNDTLPSDLFATPYSVTSLDDCLFYHTMKIPGVGVAEGEWDIRCNEAQYLGNVHFKDKRVLEIGPASGFLTFFMEGQGAEVVSLEATEDHNWEFFWDLQDRLKKDLRVVIEDYQRTITKVKNSYWFCHRAFSSKAKVCYASAYDLPKELGEFDISVLACMLLHNRNPLDIIENCTRVTKETIVIVELSFGENALHRSLVEFAPKVGDRCWNTWWRFSPNFLLAVLQTMGFPYNKVTFHTQKQFGKPVELFTIVASRKAIERTDSDFGPLDAELNSPVERLRIKANSFTHLPVSVVNLTELSFSSISKFPVYVTYRWRRLSGEVVTGEGIRSSFSRSLGKGDRDDLLVRIQAPPETGAYLLEITLVKEGVTWYDGKIPGVPLQIQATVTP